jgi:hypothetical protein
MVDYRDITNDGYQDCILAMNRKRPGHADNWADYCRQTNG